MFNNEPFPVWERHHALLPWENWFTRASVQMILLHKSVWLMDLRRSTSVFSLLTSHKYDLEVIITLTTVIKYFETSYTGCRVNEVEKTICLSACLPSQQVCISWQQTATFGTLERHSCIRFTKKRGQTIVVKLSMSTQLHSTPKRDFTCKDAVETAEFK